MAVTLTIFSVLVIAMSLYGVIWPVKILAFARRFLVSPGIWAASGLRLMGAALLWFTAPVSQTATVFRVLAALVLVAAVAIPVMGTARLVSLLECPTIVVRLQGLIGIGFGGFVLWSIWPAVAG